MAGTYDLWLVLLSVVVAITASYVALDLASRIREMPGGRARPLWLAGGCIAMGTGIWSMHFIGMLAFGLPVPVYYDIRLTLLSLAVAVIASAFALLVASAKSMGAGRLAAGGLLIGLAIVSMHYIGMDAMRMDPPIQYRPVLVGLSIVIAVAASVVALWSAFKLRLETVFTAFGKKAGAAVAMGAGICGMHYMGMAAALFVPNSICTVREQGINPAGLAGTLGGFTLLFLMATLLVAAFDAYRAEQSQRHALEVDAESQARRRAEQALKTANDALEARVSERTAALAAAVEQLRALASRLHSVREEERLAISRNVHDELGQALTAAKIDLRLLEQDLRARPAEMQSSRVLEELASVSSTLDRAIESVRSIAEELRPPVLDEAGLLAAVHWLAQDFEKRTRIRVRVVSSGSLIEPDKEHAIALFRILQESLTNVARHARANEVVIELRQEGGEYLLQVRDDGIGIPDASVHEARALGLIGIRERALAFGGRAAIKRDPRGGTLVTVAIPRAAEPPAPA